MRRLEAGAIEAQQLFIGNPAPAKNDAANWGGQTPPDRSASRPFQAMATDQTIKGFESCQSASPEAHIGILGVQQIAEYCGATPLGKVLQLANRVQHARKEQRLPSDLTNREREVLEPFF